MLCRWGCAKQYMRTENCTSASCGPQLLIGACRMLKLARAVTKIKVFCTWMNRWNTESLNTQGSKPDHLRTALSVKAGSEKTFMSQRIVSQAHITYNVVDSGRTSSYWTTEKRASIPPTWPAVSYLDFLGFAAGWGEGHCLQPLHSASVGQVATFENKCIFFTWSYVRNFVSIAMADVECVPNTNSVSFG